MSVPEYLYKVVCVDYDGSFKSALLASTPSELTYKLDEPTFSKTGVFCFDNERAAIYWAQDFIDKVKTYKVAILKCKHSGAVRKNPRCIPVFTYIWDLQDKGHITSKDVYDAVSDMIKTSSFMYRVFNDTPNGTYAVDCVTPIEKVWEYSYA